MANSLERALHTADVTFTRIQVNASFAIMVHVTRTTLATLVSGQRPRQGGLSQSRRCSLRWRRESKFLIAASVNLSNFEFGSMLRLPLERDLTLPLVSSAYN